MPCRVALAWRLREVARGNHVMSRLAAGKGRKNREKLQIYRNGWGRVSDSRFFRASDQAEQPAPAQLARRPHATHPKTVACPRRTSQQQ